MLFESLAVFREDKMWKVYNAKDRLTLTENKQIFIRKAPMTAWGFRSGELKWHPYTCTIKQPVYISEMDMFDTLIYSLSKGYTDL